MDHQMKLINYLPEFLKDIREYKAVTTVEDSEIALLWKRVEAAFDDQTLKTATNYGVSRWEKMLRIEPKNMDLEDRKNEIKARLGQQLPYTIYTLENTLKEFCDSKTSKTQEELKGYDICLLPEYTLKILIRPWNKSNKSVIETMIRQYCPANLLCLVEIRYNTYDDLSQFTYGQLSNLTHKQIREEILEDFFVISTHEVLKDLGFTHKKLGGLTHKQIQDGFREYMEDIVI